MKRENRRPTTPPPRRSRVANECIDAVLRGDLNAARAIARKNVGRCDGLAAELRSLRESLDELRCLPESPDLTDRILAAVDRGGRDARRTSFRVPIAGRFAVAAGLVVASVVAGVFNTNDPQLGAVASEPEASIRTIAPEAPDSLALGLGEISRYDSQRDLGVSAHGGSGGVLALSPIDGEPNTIFFGPLTPAQAVLNVKAKARSTSGLTK